MRNLSVALLAAAAISTSATAAFHGIYAGVNAGASYLGGKYTNGTVNPDKGTATAFSSNVGKTGGVFGGFLGYGYTFGSVYVGGEAFANWDSSKPKVFDTAGTEANGGSPLTNGKGQLKRQFAYGLKFRVGAVPTSNVLMFVSAGISAGKWQFTVNPDAASIAAVGAPAVTGATPNEIATAQKSITAKKTSPVFTAGLGLEVALHRAVAVRVAYDYHFGKKLIANQVTKGLGADSVNYTVKPNEQTATIGVVWHFQGW